MTTRHDDFIANTILYVGKIFLLAALYGITGKIGLMLAVAPNYATMIWPPSGIALGILLMHGRRLWPGILIGSFILNLTVLHGFSTENSVYLAKIATAFAVASGATLQALTGRAMVKRLFGLPLVFRQPKDMLLLFIICGPITCLIGSMIGTESFYFSGTIPATVIFSTWLTWWIGSIFGVMIFLPIIIVAPGSKNKPIWREHTQSSIPLAIFILCASASIYLHTVLTLREEHFVSTIIDKQAEKINDLISLQMGDRMVSLTHMAQRWEAAGGTPQDQWRADASHYLYHSKGIKALEWIDSSYHIRWAEPRIGNEKAIGLNILFNKEREMALKGAADRGTITLTPPLDLVQGYKGFIAYAPINMHSKFGGFIGEIFAVDDFFNDAIPKDMSNDFEIVFKHSGKEFFHHTIGKQPLYTKLTTQSTIQIYDKTWQLTIIPTESFVDSQLTFLPRAILIAGLLIATLIALTIRSIMIARIKSYHLDESNKLNTAIMSSAAYLIIATDERGVVTVFNKMAETKLGYRADEIIGKETPALWHDTDEICRRADELSKVMGRVIMPGFDVFICNAQQNGMESREWTFIAKDGSRFPGNLTVTPLRKMGASITGYLGVIEDITKRKESEEALRKSEECLQLGWRGTGVGMWDWNITANQLTYSDRFKELLGYGPNELEQSFEEWEKRLHPEDKEATFTALQAHINTRVPYDTEYRLMTKSGEWRWYRAKGQCLWDTEGKPIHMAGSLADITERKAQQQALRTSEETFRAAMENAPIGMALMSLNGDWMKVNPALCHLFGYTEKELLATNFQTITHSDDFNRDLEHVGQVLADEVNIYSYQMEKRYYHKNGSTIWALLNISLVRNAEGKPDYFISQIQDITQQKEVDRLKNEFISTVSHELRTPLTSIRGSLGLITGGALGTVPEKVLGLVEIAYKNSERLGRLINDILDIEKIESGKMEFNIQPLLLTEQIKQTIVSNQGFFDQYHVTCDYIETLPTAIVMADHDRLIQVITNLLSNAIKFSPKNGKIIITTEQQKPFIRIAVQDFGTGIPETFQPHIFKKFAQADSSDVKQKGGTGLGLSICKEMIEHMGGHINFTTEIGVGTTFTIDIPEQIHYHDLKHIVDSEKKRILICESTHHIANLLEIAIEHLGYVVDNATSAHTARKLLYESGNHYASIVIDLELSGDDGMSLIRTIKDYKATHDFPVIAVSSDVAKGKNTLDDQQIEAVYWLEKPLDAGTLIRAINDVSIYSHQRKPRILHIEDDPDILKVISLALMDYADVLPAPTLKDAEELLSSNIFELVILDLELPDGNGLRILSWMKEHHYQPLPVIIVSASEAPKEVNELVAASLIKSVASEDKIISTILAVIHERLFLSNY